MSAARVRARTGDAGFVPSTSLEVTPFRVRGSTGENALCPETSVDIRPLDVQLSIAGRRIRIRPFRLVVR